MIAIIRKTLSSYRDLRADPQRLVNSVNRFTAVSNAAIASPFPSGETKGNWHTQNQKTGTLKRSCWSLFYSTRTRSHDRWPRAPRCRWFPIVETTPAYQVEKLRVTRHMLLNWVKKNPQFEKEAPVYRHVKSILIVSLIFFGIYTIFFLMELTDLASLKLSSLQNGGLRNFR